MKPFPRTAIAFSLAAAFTVAGTQHAEAQESDWQIDFGASVQLTTISGDIGFTGVDNARTLSLGDLVSNVQPGFAIEFDVWKGDWGVLTDVFTVEYEGKAATDQNAVFTTQAEESVGRIAVARQVADGAHVYAGARFWSTGLDFRLTEPNPGTLDGSDSWVDPVIGGSIDMPIDDGWFAVLDADVGGFGVSSDLTWHAMGSIGYEVGPGWSVLVRYRATGVDYTTDTSAGGGTVNYDTIRHGTFFGLVLHF